MVGLIEGQDPGQQERGQDPDLQVGEPDPGLQVGGQDPGQQVGGRDTDLQMGGTNQCAYFWGDQTITPASWGIRSAAEDNASEDNAAEYNAAKEINTKDKVPMDNPPMVNIQSDVPIDVDGDHTQPDEGHVPKTPEEGNVQQTTDEKDAKKPPKTFQTEISAGKIKNQLAEQAGKESRLRLKLGRPRTSWQEPAGKESQTPVKSPPPAKAAPTTAAAVEDTPTSSVAEETPAEDTDTENLTNPDNPETPVNGAENCKEVTADEPVETEAQEVTTAVTEPSDETAVTEAKKTEAGPTLKPGGRKAALKDIEHTLVVIQEQNMKESKKAPVNVADNLAAQVQCVLPIWTRKPDEIEQREYDKFYNSATKDMNGPMTRDLQVPPLRSQQQAFCTVEQVRTSS
jgi:hypothetical protein